MSSKTHPNPQHMKEKPDVLLKILWSLWKRVHIPYTSPSRKVIHGPSRKIFSSHQRAHPCQLPLLSSFSPTLPSCKTALCYLKKISFCPWLVYSIQQNKNRGSLQNSMSLGVEDLGSFTIPSDVFFLRKLSVPRWWHLSSTRSAMNRAWHNRLFIKSHWVDFVQFCLTYRA